MDSLSKTKPVIVPSFSRMASSVVLFNLPKIVQTRFSSINSHYDPYLVDVEHVDIPSKLVSILVSIHSCEVKFESKIRHQV